MALGIIIKIFDIIFSLLPLVLFLVADLLKYLFNFVLLLTLQQS